MKVHPKLASTLSYAFLGCWAVGVIVSFTGERSAFGQASAGGIPLAPGVLRTIPPDPAEEETLTRPVPLVELLASLEGLEWTPNYLPKSETLVEKSKAIVLRREVWNLEFAFKPLRRIWVDMPQPTGKMQRKHIYYMVYRVKNVGNALAPKPIKDETFEHVTFGTERVNREGLTFLPHFVLAGKVLQDGQYATKEYLDRVLPYATEAIAARENISSKLYNTVEITRVRIPLSDDRNDRSIWGVVTWEDLDARINYFSIYVQGLTNAYKFVEADSFEKGSPPGQGRKLTNKTLQLNFRRAGDALFEHEEELHYGIRLEKNPTEQTKVLRLYGLKEPLDHLWIYR
ncbi:MAG: hypothetical protein U1A77_02610 [Pirellulales bacterium]